jgi:hypothetical protein
VRRPYEASSSAAWAAARRATGSLNGLQLTYESPIRWQKFHAPRVTASARRIPSLAVINLVVGWRLPSSHRRERGRRRTTLNVVLTVLSSDSLHRDLPFYVLTGPGSHRG